MKTFDEWLKQATRGLTSGSADRVCAENQQHYDSALAAAALQRADPAESFAISVVGDADTANFRYRRALLTRGLTAMEASIRRQGARQRDFIVSHPWFLFLFCSWLSPRPAFTPANSWSSAGFVEDGCFSRWAWERS